ncbi:PLP-dependent aminotransferase family protein [Acidaminobacter sp. JC074]|uniref:aminotransferase-like domain-containing protein n=1 Tax=Acidaminobacter sp. JC074 TaxID=2530199 RepID=UPI001F0D4A65|nr:PLP-dependent aminotransferase family protein [Acidaminobacter sp. JC074]MCH4888148.1 PLP-dependent aminotransferase family protein [Acidaminobacter sp. JC074]
MYRYLEIAQELEESIIRLNIKEGDRLSSVREICDRYQCHQTTALKALNYLKSKGILYSIPQSGFYLSNTKEDVYNEVALIDFQTTSPDQKLFPYKDYQQCVNQAIEQHRSSLFEYSEPQGYLPLKRAVMKLVTEDFIFTDEKNIVITTGIQQGLSILSEMDLPNNRSTILIEQPTYHRYIEYLKLNGAQVMTINRDAKGIDLEELESMFATYKIKFFYMMPRVHNVFGTSITSSDKRKIIELAYKYDVYIVEDDYMADYIVDKSNDPLITYDFNKTHVIYLRSFSKIIFPGLRVGFAVLPSRLTRDFEEKKYYSDMGTSLLAQATLCIYINNRMYERHLMKMRQLYTNRSIKMRKSLQTHMIRGTYSTTGSSIVQTCLILSKGYSRKKLEKASIKVADISKFYFNETDVIKEYLPINVSNLHVNSIEYGINKLIKVLNLQVLTDIPTE